MKHHIFYIIVLLFCHVTLSHAQDPPRSSKTLSLKDAIELALSENPLYEATKHEVVAASGLSRQAGLWSNPDLFFEAEEWPIEESFDESRYKLGLSQVIPFPGKKSLEKRVAENSHLETQTQERAKRIALIRRVRIAFYRVLLTKRLLEIGRKLSDVALSSRNTAKARLEAGESTTQEVLRAEIQYERVKSDQAEYEREYRTAESQLAVLLGRPMGHAIVPIGTLQVTAPKELLSKQSAASLEEHPLVIAAETRLKRAQAKLERVSLEPYPDVTFSLAGGRRESTDETLVDFGFSLPLPLIDTSKGNREAAAALVRKAQAELLLTKQSLHGRLEQWRHALAQLDMQVANYRIELLPRAEKALSMVLTGFKEGEYGFNDLLDTQRTTAEMRLLYERKLFELNQAIAEVESLLMHNDNYTE